MDNVIRNPHNGAVTSEEWDVQFSDIFDQINAFAEGTPINVVNPDAVTPARSDPKESSCRPKTPQPPRL